MARVPRDGTGATSPSTNRTAAALARRWARRAATGLGVASVGLLGILTHGFSALPSTYTMTGDSMAPTVGRGDWFLALPASDLPGRGALAIIEYWIDDTLFHVLRRAVGLPGDTVAMAAGRLTVNGRETAWPFRVAEPRADRTLDGPLAGTIYHWGPVVVGPDSVFVLSDTRDMVGWPDSRFFGAVPGSRVVGRYWGRLIRGRREGSTVRNGADSSDTEVVSAS